MSQDNFNFLELFPFLIILHVISFYCFYENIKEEKKSGGIRIPVIEPGLYIVPYSLPRGGKKSKGLEKGKEKEGGKKEKREN